MQINKLKKTTPRLALLASALIILALIGVVLYAYTSKMEPFKSDSTNSSTPQYEENEVNYSEPSDEQATTGNSIKEQLFEESENPNPATSSITITTVSK